MVRFCDKELCCVMEDEISRSELLSYFLDGHRNEPVCVLARGGVFVGVITYSTLLGNEVADSIRKDYVILDDTIWTNCREYFKTGKKESGQVEMLMLPVLNKDHYLICFAWYENEANRELRMLEELMECEGAINFRDVYPEYEGVTICGCNELAYSLVCYLKRIGIAVSVMGDLWEELGVRDQDEVLEYKNYIIYAEGIEVKEKDVELRQSVSAEFECIDIIYEKNICEGIIRNVSGTFYDVREKLNGKQIVIVGTDAASVNAYDLLLEYGYDICGFISWDVEQQGRTLFLKPILSIEDAIEKLEDLVIVDGTAEHSAWGSGVTDDCHWWGYKRNQAFFMLKDYLVIPDNGWRNVINNLIEKAQKRLVLAGEARLCLKLKELLTENNQCPPERIVYADILGRADRNRLACLDWEEIEENDFCLLVLPEYYGGMDTELKLVYREKEKRKYIEKIKKTAAADMADYSVCEEFMIRKIGGEECDEPELRIGKIVLSAINGFSGSTLTRDLLDGHPGIIKLDYGYLNDNLFSICIRLAMERSDRILALFWELYNTEKSDRWGIREDEMPEKEKFNSQMKEMLKIKEKYTSKELFVMIHLAHARAASTITADNSEIVIYWEPHNVPRDRCENYAVWLKGICNSGYIMNVVRNAYIRAGSWLKGAEEHGHPGDERVNSISYYKRQVFRLVLGPPDSGKKEYDGWERIVMRFEDMKCHPRKELSGLCERLGISWSETLLQTTLNGKTSFYDGITGFDLTPVYRDCEEYFSMFDKFRISLITAPWQRKYGYPFVSSLDFSRRQLQEIFAREFRFEEKITFCTEEEKRRFKKWRRWLINNYLWMVRKTEVLYRNGILQEKDVENKNEV